MQNRCSNVQGDELQVISLTRNKAILIYGSLCPFEMKKKSCPFSLQTDKSHRKSGYYFLIREFSYRQTHILPSALSQRPKNEIHIMSQLILQDNGLTIKEIP